MRMPTFRINKAANLHGPRIPAARLAPAGQLFRRRVKDDLEAVFNRARASGDIEAAADILAVMEKWHARQVAGYGRKRRIDDQALQAVRRELERLSASREFRVS